MAERGPAARGSAWAGDLLIWLVLGVLLTLAWWVSRQGWFESGDDVGYWLGVAGGVLMLLLFGYPLRKRLRLMQRWGKAKWWFWVHMALGIFGPLLILVHSHFAARSLNAAAALYSMLLVAGSGVVGRFIYARINLGLHGERADLIALQARAGFDRTEAGSRLAFVPTVETRLRAFADRHGSARPGLPTSFFRVLALPLQRWWVARQCRRDIANALRALADQGRWEPAALERRERLANKLVARYLDAALRVAQFTAYERLFSLWHVAHLPFVYLLIVSAIVHVVAVHAY